MSACGKAHLELDANGIGKCSVPMYCMGRECFCDNPAYSKRPSGREYWSYGANQMMRLDYRYSGYVPALACTHHGGDGPKFEMDGNMWRATTSTFVNLQESHACFGATKPEAEVDLLANIAKAEHGLDKAREDWG